MKRFKNKKQIILFSSIGAFALFAFAFSFSYENKFVSSEGAETFNNGFSTKGGATLNDGVYTINGNTQSLVSDKEYSSFIMEWDVVSSSATSNFKGQAISITMGSVCYTDSGYYFVNDIRSAGDYGDYGWNRPLCFYMPDSSSGVKHPFTIPGVSDPEGKDSNVYQCGCVSTFRLEVYENTLTLFEFASSKGTWKTCYTYTNEYIVGTTGKVSLSVVNSGQYQVKNLCITDFGEKSVYFTQRGALSRRISSASTSQSLIIKTKPGVIKYNTYNSTCSIKYTNLIEKTGYDAIKNYVGSKLEIGMLVGAKKNVGDVLDFADINSTNKAKKILLDKTKSWYTIKENGVIYYAFNVSLDSFSSTQYQEQIIARTYIKLNYSDGTNDVMYGAVDKIGSNCKSIEQIARDTLNRGTNLTSAKITLLKKYVGSGYKRAAYYNNGVTPISSFISPTTSYTYKSGTSPNLITDTVFKELQSSGINILCGSFENDEQNKQILNLSYKYGLMFLPRCDYYGFAYWDATKKKIVNYDEFSTAEKKMTDLNFKEYLRRWSKYDAFGGVMAGDEIGYLIAPAYKHMQEVFKTSYSDKYFSVNMMGPMSNASLFDIHREYAPFVNEASAAGLTGGNYTWEQLVERYGNYVNLDIMSFDNYMFNTVNNTKVILNILYSDIYKFLSQFASSGKQIWYYVATGQFGGIPDQTEGETYFQANAPFAVGATSIALFPGFSPVTAAYTDCNNLYDRSTGQPTIYMTWYKELLKQVHACEEYMNNGEFVGTMHSVIKSTNRIEEDPNNTFCYEGRSPTYYAKNTLTSFGKVSGMSVSSGKAVVAGCYNYGTKKAMWIVNSSYDTALSTNLTLSSSSSYTKIQAGASSSGSGSSISLSLKAGEAVMIVFE